MRGVFVSGWCGFRGLFGGLADDFSFYTPFYDDLSMAFTGGGRNLVCWSTGSNLALKQASLDFENIILAAPFIRFTDHTPEKILKRMIKKFAAEPETVIRDFLSACSCPQIEIPAGADMSKLKDGLEYLLDSGSGVCAVKGNIKILHGENDAIVSPEAGRAAASMLGAEYIRIEGCGHFIPPEIISEYLI